MASPGVKVHVTEGVTRSFCCTAIIGDTCYILYYLRALNFTLHQRRQLEGKAETKRERMSTYMYSQITCFEILLVSKSVQVGRGALILLYRLRRGFSCPFIF